METSGENAVLLQKLFCLARHLIAPVAEVGFGYAEHPRRLQETVAAFVKIVERLLIFRGRQLYGGIGDVFIEELQIMGISVGADAVQGAGYVIRKNDMLFACQQSPGFVAADHCQPFPQLFQRKHLREPFCMRGGMRSALHPEIHNDREDNGMRLHGRSVYYTSTHL